MTEYHKIQSIYLRDEKTKYKTFLEGQYTMEEFSYLENCTWSFEEKVDGTNIRIMFDGERVTFGGRTDAAQTPTFLLAKLQELFPVEKLKEVFPGTAQIVLYGEGYGAKIQKGGGDYISDGCNFILFDVKVGHLWLRRQDVEAIAEKLCINVTPVVGKGPLQEAIDMCRFGFASHLRSSEPEGLVIRPLVPLFARNGDRIITKVKLKDFAPVLGN